MRKSLVAGARFAGAAAVLGAQDKPVQNPPDKKPEGVLIAPQGQRDVIRRSVDLVTNTVIVRDPQGQFVADLGKKDFEVLRRRQAGSHHFVLTHGGRVINDDRRRLPAGRILLPPPGRPTTRRGIFLIF